MPITVLYFAKIRVTVGVSRETFADCETVQDVLNQVVKAHPAVAPMLPSCAISLNEEYVEHSQPVSNGDTIGIIPPVSGG